MWRVDLSRWNLAARFDRLDRTLDTLLAKETTMAKTLDDVLADVTAETTVTQSAITLLQQIKAALDAAIASGDVTKIQAISDQLEANTAALAAAVTANTPAA